MSQSHRQNKSSRNSRQRTRRLLVEALEQRVCLTLPAFSSLPGANHTLYLDFDGQTVSGTSWNSYYNQTTLTAQPFDLDGNPASFNATELARIEEAWKRTAEDFRPFNINVTTVDPGVEALRKSGAGDTQWGVRAIITKESTMVNDPNEHCGCGGIAYIDSFNWSSDTPVWVYTTGGKSIAEAASHEAGHSLGLSHDGLIGGPTYYSGHGSGETGWASIMGVGYYQNVTQWDRGEYYNSNNGGSGANYGDGPDDLALIVGAAGPGNGFGYRPDDHGNTNLTASSLGLSGTTVADEGVIETTNDVDVFSFTTGAGLVTLNIDPFTPGPNLDVKADLYDGSGSLVATSNSSTVLDAGFSLSLPAGQYFLHVDGTGWGDPGSSPPSGYTQYASLGQYSISGSIVEPGGLPRVSIGDASADENAGTITFAVNLSAAAETATAVAWSTSDGSATAGSDYVAASGTVDILPGETTASITVTLTDDSDYEGDEQFFVVLTNATALIINDGQGVGTIHEDDAPPLPTISIGDASVTEGKLNTKGKNSGTPQLTDMTFTLTLSTASSQTVTVQYSTVDGTPWTATEGVDYQAAGDTVTFAPGQTSTTINVTIYGDNNQELDETFGVQLTDATNATIARGTGTGTILDDDSGSGGGGKGGGKGGKGNKISSEESPVAIADPIWFFEGPDGAHDHEHEHHDHETSGGQLHDHELLASVGVSSVSAMTAQLTQDTIGGTSAGKGASSGELVDLAMRDMDVERTASLVQEHNPLLERLAAVKQGRSNHEDLLLDQLLADLTTELAACV